MTKQSRFLHRPLPPKNWAAILLFLSIPILNQASHIVGGDLHYEYLGNDQYLITLKVYRDCATSSTPFDDPASIGIFSGTTLEENLEIDLADAIITLLPIETNSICVSPPDGICVEEAIFSKVVTLPPVPGGYTLAYQRCCRNVTIVNTESNDDIGITLTTSIPDQSVAFPNSNPQFVQYPPLVICLNYPFVFDNSATDPDGDQLVYEFCTPLLTNVPGYYINPPGAPDYPELTFNPGYSYDYPIDSDPAFQIDPVTGILTGTPTMIGQFVVGICVNEYRNGILINTTNRDFQFNVVICEPNTYAAIAEQETDCSGLTVVLDNLSTTGLDYAWDFGDPNVEDDVSDVYEPEYTYADTGLYTIQLIVNPDLPCADTATMLFHAVPVLLPVISSYESTCVNGVMHYDFNGEGGFSGSPTYAWDFGPNAQPSTSSAEDPQDIVLSDTPGTVDVTLTIYDSTCDETLVQEVEIPIQPVAAIADQETFCDGLFYTFENLSENASGFFWDFGAPGNTDVSALENAEYMYPDTGLYTVFLIASSPGLCADTAFTTLNIYGLLQPWFAEPASQCFDSNSFDFEALGASTSDAVYTWDFGEVAEPSVSMGPNPQNIVYSDSGTYDVVLTVQENDCEESFTGQVEIVPNPVIDAFLENTSGCPDLYVQFHNNSSASTSLNYLWNFGDGTTSTAANPVHVYAIPGTYDVQLTIFTLSGCIESLDLFFDNAVVVLPQPQAGFQMEPGVVDILSSTVDVSDQSVGSTSCIYYLPDGSMSTDCDFSYTFLESGVQWVTQWVFNDVGCSDQASGYVIVNGFAFFAPNSFSPNQDGINDVWMPSVTGTSDCSLRIYDRWGEVIFETTDPDEPWIGDVRSGSHFAADGVYVYRVVLHDLRGLPHDYTGHITLLR